MPILMLHGEQGSAKSTLQELIKMLVDPSIIRTLSFPRDINELIQQLSHNHVAYLDNISNIKEWYSDQLCRAVTGSGFSKRQLWTDDDDIIYSFKRCIGFNSINK
jgi:Holliday junction resolvasome RuvABC ATP-dependent DNA helicase subunit